MSMKMMRMKNLKNKVLSCVTAAALALTLGAGVPAVKVYAESGAIYSCTINRAYSHPVTGVIEDSGGESSYATGQGMVEGAVYPDGMMEVTESGGYYLTIKMSLMDYTSGHSFVVQNTGDSGWMNTSTAITATGSDSNGTTADICIQVPSENCIVRGSMYVSPMGRDVVFYLYPSNYSEGNSVGMTPMFVTESSGSEATAQTSDGSVSYESADGSVNNADSGTVSAGSVAVNGALSSTGTTDTESETDAETADLTPTPTPLVTAAPVSSEEVADTDSSLNSAQGLSLSTASDYVEDETGNVLLGAAATSVVMEIIAITVSGLILLTAGAGVVYYFRKNWRRWGGEDDDDDYEE